MAPLLSKINVAVLFVSNLELSREFYEEKIGFDAKWADESNAGYDVGSTMLIILNRAGGADLLSAGLMSAPAEGVRSQLVSFVDDVDGVYKELSGRGVEFVREPVDRPWGLRTAHFRDPDGNIWELAQETAQSSE